MISARQIARHADNNELATLLETDDTAGGESDGSESFGNGSMNLMLVQYAEDNLWDLTAGVVRFMHGDLNQVILDCGTTAGKIRNAYGARSVIGTDRDGVGQESFYKEPTVHGLWATFILTHSDFLRDAKKSRMSERIWAGMNHSGAARAKAAGSSMVTQPWRWLPFSTRPPREQRMLSGRAPECGSATRRTIKGVDLL